MSLLHRHPGNKETMTKIAQSKREDKDKPNSTQ